MPGPLDLEMQSSMPTREPRESPRTRSKRRALIVRIRFWLRHSTKEPPKPYRHSGHALIHYYTPKLKETTGGEFRVDRASIRFL